MGGPLARTGSDGTMDATCVCTAARIWPTRVVLGSFAGWERPRRLVGGR